MHHGGFRQSTGGILATAVVLATLGISHPATADTITNIDLSSQFNGQWATAYAGTNGSLIAAAPAAGNTGSGLTFGNYNGNFVAVGPDETQASPLTITFGTPVLLNGDAAVNALMNTFYGVSGTVNATIIFTNSNSNTAVFSLVGNQTVRDFNNNIYANNLPGQNTDSSYGAVTAVNWWNDAGSGDNQRLDAQTFVLPSSWDGTNLISMQIVNPYTTTSTNDVVLSALQVNDRTPVPEPTSLALLGTPLLGLVVMRRRLRA